MTWGDEIKKGEMTAQAITCSPVLVRIPAAVAGGIWGRIPVMERSSLLKKIRGAAAVALAVGMLLFTTAWAAGKEASSMQAVQDGLETVELKDGPAGQPVVKKALNESQRQALERILQIVPELEGLSVVNLSDEGDAIWTVTLDDSDGAAASGIMHTRAELVFETNSGELIGFHVLNPDWASDELPAAGPAKEKAAEFARRVLGDKMKDYQMRNQISYGGGCARDEQGNEITWATADVQFERLINGIPFLDSCIRVSVDAAGHVVDYYTEGYYKRNDSVKDSGQDPAVFPDPALAMTKQAAEGIYANLLEMKLNYVERKLLQYPEPGKEEVETRPVLQYTPTTYALIDAVTGKSLAESQERLPASLIRLAGEGKKLVAGTPEEAIALIAAETGIDISGMKFMREDERGDNLKPGIKMIEYNWGSGSRAGNEDMPDYSIRLLTIIMLADTGQVTDFSLYDESGRGKKTTISRETAQETAIQFMQKHLEQGTAELEMCVYSTQDDSIPDWVDRSKLEYYGQRPAFKFTFTYTYQGIPVLDRFSFVTVDGLTGCITAYSGGNSSPPVTLPDSRNVVTPEAAKAEFLKSQPLRLVYLWPEYFGQKAPKPLLVYMQDHSYGGQYIDALTGKTVTLEMK